MNDLTFLKKGGKLWRGGAGASGTTLTTLATPATLATSEKGDGKVEKSPAVRFIHLNDTTADEDEEEASRCGVANSAFQQLFPRARKLIQVT